MSLKGPLLALCDFSSPPLVPASGVSKTLPPASVPSAPSLPESVMTVPAQSAAVVVCHTPSEPTRGRKREREEVGDRPDLPSLPWIKRCPLNGVGPSSPLAAESPPVSATVADPGKSLKGLAADFEGTPDIPQTQAGSQTSDGEGPYDRFLGPTPKQASTEPPLSLLPPLGSDHLSQLAWQGNMFAEDPQYFEGGLPPDTPRETTDLGPTVFETTSATRVFVAALGDDASEVALLEGLCRQWGLDVELQGSALQEGELIAAGSAMSRQRLLDDSQGSSLQFFVVSLACFNHGRSTRGPELDPVRREFASSVRRVLIE